MNSYFVTGTDTDAGKTLVACALLANARQAGRATLGLKPLAAGGEDFGEGLQNDDAVQLQRLSTVQLEYSQVNPVLLSEPMAPHIAAEREGKQLTASSLVDACRQAMKSGESAELCLIEGAGGWRVPLNDHETVAELAKALQIPVILVVGMKLGCLNHALLTAQAIASDGLQLAAWVATQTDPNMSVVQENLQTLEQMLAAPCLGYIPWLDNASASQAAGYLSIDALRI